MFETTGWELLDHPSDVGIRAWGPTRADALCAASQGLSAVLADPTSIEPKVQCSLFSEGRDEAEQVVGWLNELIFHFDTSGLLFREFRVESWEGRRIEGVATGEPFDPSRHELRTAIKAVTYHQYQSGPTANGWEFRVFVDV